MYRFTSIWETMIIHCITKHGKRQKNTHNIATTMAHSVTFCHHSINVGIAKA